MTAQSCTNPGWFFTNSFLTSTEKFSTGTGALGQYSSSEIDVSPHILFQNSWLNSVLFLSPALPSDWSSPGAFTLGT